MTEKTRKQIEDMKKSRFGLEVEMNHITREKAAKIAAELFGTGRYRNTAAQNGYCTVSAWDAQGREWKFQRDSSIPGPDREKCEVVSPILVYEDLELMQELLRRLRKAGAKSSGDKGMGIHCHVDASGHTPQSLRNLANLMASHENLLIDALKLDRGRVDRWCRTVDPDFLKELNKKKPKTMSQLAEIWYTTQGGTYGRNQHYHSSRYHCLNYHATFTKGTVEFRCFNFEPPADGRKNGIHAGYIRMVVQLCLALSQMAKDLKTASPKEQQKENPKFAMRTFLIRLGMVGPEFATAREFLTKNLAGDAAFRHGRPASTAVA